jgi:probable F420-dependent oxidoreductase
MRFIATLVLDDDFPSLLEQALAAERSGFAAVLVPDHFHVPAEPPRAGGIAESWTTLAALAARTERIRIGGAVMCNLFRHPCLTAQIAASVDQISAGRLELGLGAGWMEEEFRRTGIGFPGAGERIAMLAEALEIILPALEGDPVTFEGRYYQVRDFSLLPGSVQEPRPPLHIGGGGDKLLRVAARHAEIVSLAPPAIGGRIAREAVMAFTADRLAERVRFLRSAAEEHGRDPKAIEVLGFSSVVHVAGSEAEARDVLEGMARFFDTDPAQVQQHPTTLVGTPSQIVAILEERRERCGIDSIMIAARSTETLEVFGKEIVPRLSGSRAG